MKFFLPFIFIASLLFGKAIAQTSFYRPYKPAAGGHIKAEIITGADQTKLYIDYLKGKNIGMVINQTSVIGNRLTLSADTFIKAGITIKKYSGPSMVLGETPATVPSLITVLIRKAEFP